MGEGSHVKSMGYLGIAVYTLVHPLCIPSPFLIKDCFRLGHPPGAWPGPSLRQALAFLSPVTGLGMSTGGIYGQGDVSSVVGPSGKCFLVVKKRQTQEWKVFFPFSGCCVWMCCHTGGPPSCSHEGRESEGKGQAKNGGTGGRRESTSLMVSFGSCICSPISGLPVYVIYVLSVGIWRWGFLLQEADSILPETKERRREDTEKDVTRQHTSRAFLSVAVPPKGGLLLPVPASHLRTLKPFLSLGPYRGSQVGTSPF